MTVLQSAAKGSEEAGRQAAVAGRFYPAVSGTLKTMVNGFIAAGHELDRAPGIIICPHAGYQFSGPVAGFGYATIDPAVRTVILLGPPHYVPVQGIAASSATWFETPLGRVPLDRERVRALLDAPTTSIDDRAHAPEHCLEVQLPFLQARLRAFTIVPLLVSQLDPGQAADCIFPLIDRQTVVVVSSDLSHYLSHREARARDDESIAAILSGNTDGTIDACGELPIRVAMVLAGRMGLEPQLLDSRTSFDTSPAFGPDRVVGYASIAYCGTHAPAPATTGILTDEVKGYLLRLARRSLEASVRSSELPSPRDFPLPSGEQSGCFVTLTIHGELRGCIGYIEPIIPLYRAVMENARNAALADPRFPQVSPDELPSITIEVSVLSQPVGIGYRDPADLLSKIVPKVDGIILQGGPHQATFLPQVWEQLPDPVQFLEHLSLKAGMERDGWKSSTVKRYRVEHFRE